jgi:hypothetical protein
MYVSQNIFCILSLYRRSFRDQEVEVLGKHIWIEVQGHPGSKHKALYEKKLKQLFQEWGEGG